MSKMIVDGEYPYGPVLFPSCNGTILNFKTEKVQWKMVSSLIKVGFGKYHTKFEVECSPVVLHETDYYQSRDWYCDAKFKLRVCRHENKTLEENNFVQYEVAHKFSKNSPICEIGTFFGRGYFECTAKVRIKSMSGFDQPISEFSFPNNIGSEIVLRNGVHKLYVDKYPLLMCSSVFRKQIADNNGTNIIDLPIMFPGILFDIEHVVDFIRLLYGKVLALKEKNSSFFFCILKLARHYDVHFLLSELEDFLIANELDTGTNTKRLTLAEHVTLPKLQLETMKKITIDDIEESISDMIYYFSMKPMVKTVNILLTEAFEDLLAVGEIALQTSASNITTSTETSPTTMPFVDHFPTTPPSYLTTSESINNPEYSTSSFLGEEGRMIMIVVVGTIFAILTSVGNLMVMVSFKIDKQLQTISNYFLFSLAVADIAIGVISIPMFTYYTAMETWDIGYTMCQFWLCIDYLMSNASVLNLLLISFDRYFSVTRPLSYRPRRTTKKALTMIACTYIISMILWPPWIISWPYIEGKFTAAPGTCVVQFLQTNPYVTVGTAVAAFYLPVSIMCILYTRVYWETQKRQKEFGKLQATQFSRRSIKRDVSSTSIVKSSGSMRKKMNNNGDAGEDTPQPSSRTSKRRSWLRNCTGRSNSSSEESSEAAAMNLDDTSLSSSHFTQGGSKRRNCSPPSTPLPTNFEDDEQTDAGASMRNGSARFRTRPVVPEGKGADTYTVLIELNDDGNRPSVRLSSCEPYLDCDKSRNRSKSDCNSIDVEERRHSLLKHSPLKNGRILKNFSSTSERKSEKEQRKNERKQESKAAKTLSAILCAFIATWTPYNLIVCWEAFYPNTVPSFLWTFSYFLCYINSTINPLCYALCNARFRHTYKRILRCKFKAERPVMSHGYVRRKN